MVLVVVGRERLAEASALEEPPPDPCKDRPDLGPGVSGALLTALEKDPAARPQSAGAYAELLRAAFE